MKLPRSCRAAAVMLPYSRCAAAPHGLAWLSRGAAGAAGGTCASSWPSVLLTRARARMQPVLCALACALCTMLCARAYWGLGRKRANVFCGSLPAAGRARSCTVPPLTGLSGSCWGAMSASARRGCLLSWWWSNSLGVRRTYCFLLAGHVGGGGGRGRELRGALLGPGAHCGGAPCQLESTTPRGGQAGTWAPLWSPPSTECTQFETT